MNYVEKEQKKADDKVQEKIEKVRDELHKSIESNGIDSDITRRISNKMDALINKYYNKRHDKAYPQESIMYKNYKISYKHLTDITIQLGDFPSVEKWNAYAEQNACMSSISIQYISNCNWHELRNKINLFDNKNDIVG